MVVAGWNLLTWRNGLEDVYRLDIFGFARVGNSVEIFSMIFCKCGLMIIQRKAWVTIIGGQFTDTNTKGLFSQVVPWGRTPSRVSLPLTCILPFLLQFTRTHIPSVHTTLNSTVQTIKHIPSTIPLFSFYLMYLIILDSYLILQAQP